jgi:hypothetical protein
VVFGFLDAAYFHDGSLVELGLQSFSLFLLYDDRHYWCRGFLFVTFGLIAPEFCGRVDIIYQFPVFDVFRCAVSQCLRRSFIEDE